MAQFTVLRALQGEEDAYREPTGASYDVIWLAYFGDFRTLKLNLIISDREALFQLDHRLPAKWEVQNFAVFGFETGLTRDRLFPPP